MTHIAFRSAATLLALALFHPAAAFAQYEPAVPFLHFGPLIIHPSLTAGLSYTDNVFATADDTKSDFVAWVKPGLQLTLAEGFNLEGFTFGINANTANGSKFSELNRIDWNIYGRGAVTIRERLTVEIGETYTPSHLTPLESTSGGLEKFSTNEAKIGLKYDFLDLWQARLAYTNTNYDYADSENRSRVENLFSTGVFFRILPKTSVFASYDFTLIDYDDSLSTLNNDKQAVSVGATWEITEITKGTVEAGYRSVDFKDSSENGWSTWGASVDLRHELTELATLKLKGERSIQEGMYTGTRYMVSTGLAAELAYQFLDRLTGTATAGYFVADFSDVIPGDAVVRKDKAALAGLGAGYSFRSWLQFDLNYSYLNRNSNIDYYSATVNTVSIQATARF